MGTPVTGNILEAGDKIEGKWKVVGKIAGGGFGQIYRVNDPKLKKEVVAKIEPIDRKQIAGKKEKPEQRKEAAILEQYQGKPHAPEFIGSGATKRYNYLIMQLLSINLTQLRKKSPHQRLSIGTTYRVIEQGVEALRDLHKLGYVHRDVKPSNFATGLTSETMHTIYIFDFGLARRFVEKTGGLRTQRSKTGFRGTVRYSSVAAHKEMELGRHDDLWSLFYTLIELVTGTLPWRQVKDKKKAQLLKEKTTVDTLCRNIPRSTTGFGNHLQTLTYSDEPDYNLLCMITQKVVKDANVKKDDPFDWEEDYKNVKPELIKGGRRRSSSGRKPPSHRTSPSDRKKKRNTVCL